MRSERHRPSVEIIGKIAGEEVIAVGGKIREIERLRKVYGRGRWRKRKGIAVVRLPMEQARLRRYTGTKVTASAGRNSRSSGCLVCCDQNDKVNQKLRALRPE
jgi:hypothetical protein